MPPHTTIALPIAPSFLSQIVNYKTDHASGFIRLDWKNSILSISIVSKNNIYKREFPLGETCGISFSPESIALASPDSVWVAGTEFGTGVGLIFTLNFDIGSPGSEQFSPLYAGVGFTRADAITRVPGRDWVLVLDLASRAVQKIDLATGVSINWADESLIPELRSLRYISTYEFSDTTTGALGTRTLLTRSNPALRAPGLELSPIYTIVDILNDGTCDSIH